VTGGDQQTTIGIALIALAVVLGLVFLVKGFSDDDGLVASDTPETTSTTVPEVDRDAPPVIDSSTTVPLTIREPGDVPVLVANGSGVNGAAGRLAETLRAEEYDVVNTANALQTVTETQVLYAEGFQTEAETLAEVLGLTAAAAQPLGEPAPVDDLEGAEVVVVIGPDVAAADAGGTTATTAASGDASTDGTSTSSSSSATTTG
jgi:hypothetical protein